MSGKKNTKKKNKLKSGNSRSKRQSARVKPPDVDAQALQRAVKNNPTNFEAAVSLAEHYYRVNQETKILDLLRPLNPAAIPSKSPARFRYITLQALGQALSGEMSEAEQSCQQGLDEFPGALDFYFILSYIKISMREFKSTAEHANKYLELLESNPVLKDMPLPLCGTRAHLSQLENMLGSAYRETKKIEPAIKHYQLAIAADPGNHLPYLNLTSTYTHVGEIDKAKEVVARGLTKCKQIQDLRIVEQSLLNRRTISACMIVKNEEQLLPDCLESVRNWVDEIIIVDTGSTDRTVEIAESYGARVFHQKWEGDFSKHRNYSLEQAKSDWIFVIDADERLCEEDVPRLRELINSDSHSIISINVINVYGKKLEATTLLPSIRLFRRNANLRYEGIVHNRLTFPPDASVVRANVNLKHLGYDLTPDQMNNKFERSKALLEMQLQNNPDDAFAMFNMAQLLRGVGRNNPAQVSDEIIKYASRAVELTNPDELQTRNIHIMALDQLGWAYFYKKDYENALETAQKAISHKKNYLDPILLLGHIYSQLQDFEKARDSYLRYIDFQKHYDPTSEKDNLILVNPDSRATAFYGLGMLYEMQNKPSEALNNYQKTAELNPNHLDVQNRISILESKHDSQTGDLSVGEKLLIAGKTEEAERVFQELINSSSDKSDITEKIAQLNFANGQFHQARKYFWQILNTNPNDPKILNDLANCHFKLYEYEKALEYYEAAAELPDAPVILFRNMGITCSILKQFASAIVSFRKYIAEQPDDAEVYTIMADLYSKTGDFATALPLYEKVLQVDPSDFASVFNLSECYLNLGHEESAKMGYNRVLELKPDFEPARKRLTQLDAVSAGIQEIGS